MKTHLNSGFTILHNVTHSFLNVMFMLVWPDILLCNAVGLSKMQSSVMAFFPNIATAKLDLHSLYRKYVNMFSISSNNSRDGCHVTDKMAHLPVLLIDRTFFSTGTAFRSIAISYGALILRWLLGTTSVVQVSFEMYSNFCYNSNVLLDVFLFWTTLLSNVVVHLTTSNLFMLLTHL